jgi:hypothetical protein
MPPAAFLLTAIQKIVYTKMYVGLKVNPVKAFGGVKWNVKRPN